MNNETDIGIKFSASVNGNKKLQELANSLSRIKGVADGLNTGAIDSIEIGAKETKTIAKNTSTMASTMKLAFNYSTVRMFARSINRVTKELTRLATKSSEYLENVNLFQVAFDNNYQSAEKFINKLTEMYGLDESRITRVVGIFKQLGNAMNVSEKTGEKLAELMTQMSLDISSLYNIDFERATSVLQSAFSGQTKPIRGATGADITQSTLQTTLDSLGIDRAVNQLTFAEKRLLIIISLTQQLKEATNDLGRTIESPANQMKILSEQWQRLSRALGNTFLPILAKILPYLNAIMMVLTEIINMIAKVIQRLFGFKDSDFDYFSGVDDSVIDLEDNIGKTTAGVGKLKKALSGLRSFDKLNVISTPSSGGGAGGGGGSGLGIDEGLLKAFDKAFDSYQNKLENVRMKATKIRDAIMEWLGFTKEIDPETGKVVFKYKGIGTTLKNIVKWLLNFKSPLAIITKALAWIIGKKVLSGLTKIFSLISKSKLVQKVKNLIFPLEYLGLLIKDELLKGTQTFGKAIGTAMDKWSQSLTKIEKFKVGLIGSAGLLGAFKLIDSAMEDIAKTGEVTSESVIKSIGGISLNALSLATMLGSQFGKEGFVIGAILGGTVGMIEIIDGLINASSNRIDAKLKEDAKKISELNKDIEESQKNLNEAYRNSDAHTEYYNSLLTELNNIVDENGNVKDGYEDRAKVITTTLAEALGIEIELSKNQIKNWQKIREEIDKLIVKKGALAKLDALEEEYNKAIVNKTKAIEAESDAYSTLTETTATAGDKFKSLAADNARARDALKEFEDAGMSTADMIHYMNENYSTLNDNQRFLYNRSREQIEQFMKAENQYKDAADKLDYYNGVIYDWEKATEYAVTENYEALDKYFDHDRNLRGKNLYEQENYWEGIAEKNKRYLDNLERNKDKYDKNYYESQKKAFQDQINLADSELTRLQYLSVRKVEDISDDMIDYFYQTGSKSKDKFLSELGQLPQDIQDEVISKLKEKGKDVPEELQKGIDEYGTLKTTVKVDGDTSPLDKTISKWSTSTKIGKAVAELFKIQIPKNAEGGLPPVGQIFVANEKGPELVGQIGGQSFVANQNQIVDFLQKEAGNVKGGQKGTQVYNIYLDENHKIGTYTLEQLQGMAKTNGKPIQIG